MYNKGKGPPPPSDASAREKLILYVYEYLIHNGAQKAASTFLNEIRWDKAVSIGEAPGFLQSWWCVFWDLYCAAPERRDTCEHSAEAKSFHDYGFVNSAYPVNGITHNPNSASPLGQMNPNDGLSGGPMPPGSFFPHQNSHMRPSPPQQPSQPAPHQQPPPPPHGQMMQNQAFMSPRYPSGPRPGVRMPQQVDFNGPPVSSGSGPGTPMMPNPQGDGGDYVGWQGPPGLGQMNHRMNPPRGQPMGPMNPGNYGGMRPPNASMGPGVPGGMSPGMSMGGPVPGPGPGPGPGGRPWQPNTSNMNYSSASPGSHYGGPPVSGGSGPPGPGTPIMPSPQGSAGPYSPASHRMGTPNTGRDSSGSGGDGMYPMMKPGGNMPGFPMGPGQGPEGPMSQLGPDLGPPMSSGGNGLDGMKNSPANGPGTPREDGVGGPMSDYGISSYGQENDQNENEAIMKIKESMQEEAKKFEKDTTNDHPENFMPF